MGMGGRSLVPMAGEASVQVQMGMCREERTAGRRPQGTLKSTPKLCSHPRPHMMGNGPHCQTAPSPSVPQHSPAGAADRVTDLPGMMKSSHPARSRKLFKCPQHGEWHANACS